MITKAVVTFCVCFFMFADSQHFPIEAIYNYTDVNSG